MAATSSIITHSFTRGDANALIETIIGGGTIGLAYTLWQDTQNNMLVEGAKHLYYRAGFGSYIGQIRLHVQKGISLMEPNGNVDTILMAEKGAYLVAGLIGALLIIDGLEDLLPAKERK